MDKSYNTSNYYLAGYLSYMGFPIMRVDGQGQYRKVWFFALNHDGMNAFKEAQKYYASSGEKVDPLRYRDHLSRIREIPI